MIVNCYIYVSTGSIKKRNRQRPLPSWSLYRCGNLVGWFSLGFAGIIHHAIRLQDMPQDMTLHKLSSDRRSLHKPHPAQILPKQNAIVLPPHSDALENASNPNPGQDVQLSGGKSSCHPEDRKSSRPCRGRCNPLTVTKPKQTTPAVRWTEWPLHYTATILAGHRDLK